MALDVHLTLSYAKDFWWHCIIVILYPKLRLLYQNLPYLSGTDLS